MNYMTGLALGMSAGQQLYSLWNKEKSAQLPVGFTLVHSLPGRRRYHHALLQEEPGFAAFVQHYFPLLRRIRSCEINELSGNIVICFLPDEEAYVEAGLNLLETLYQRKTPYGKIGSNVRRATGRLNRFIRAETKQSLDIRTIAAGIMFIAGIKKCLMGGQTFGGPNLLWWSYSLMKGSK